MTDELSRAKRLAREKVRGLWIAIPTPFTESGLVDEERLAESAEYYTSGLKVDGIFCGGMMGEFWALTLEERRRVHEIVVQQVAGRIPVMAHTGHHVFADCVELSGHAAEIGVDFSIVVNPYYPPAPPEEVVRAWYARLARETDIPIFLFNTRYSGYTLSPELIAELADLDPVCGIKNPRPRGHLLRTQALAGERIVVTDASEADWLDLHLNHGFQSLMSTPALAMVQTPESRPVADYTALADEGRLEEAWALQRSLEPRRRAFGKWMGRIWEERHLMPIAYLKTWLELMGLPQGPVRPPLLPVSREEREVMRRDLEPLGLLDAVRTRA